MYNQGDRVERETVERLPYKPTIRPSWPTSHAPQIIEKPIGFILLDLLSSRKGGYLSEP